MSAAGRETEADYSRGTRPERRPGAASGAARALLIAAATAGVALLVFATFTSIIDIRVASGSVALAGRKSHFSGFDRHSVALLVIAALALPMTLGAARGARPALALLAVCGAATIVIAIGVDRPDIHSSGAIGRDYALASATAGPGYYAETLAGVLLLLSGGGGLLAAWDPVRGRSRRQARPPRETEQTEALPAEQRDTGAWL